MGKIKRGQRVTHRTTGRTGVVYSIYRGIVWMKDGKGSGVKDYGSTYHKASSKGCLLLLFFALAIPFTVALASWKVFL